MKWIYNQKSIFLFFKFYSKMDSTKIIEILQAYERLTLLMERINPSQMMVRISPLSDDKTDYQNLVIAQIDQEFEHNLSQQIYV